MMCKWSVWICLLLSRLKSKSAEEDSRLTHALVLPGPWTSVLIYLYTCLADVLCMMIATTILLYELHVFTDVVTIWRIGCLMFVLFNMY